MRKRWSRLFLLCGFALQAWFLPAASLRSDEQVIFFPGLGWETDDGFWNLEVRGWVFERERRPGAARLLMKYLAIDPDLLSPAEKATFTSRSRLFLIDAEHGKEVAVRIAGKTHTLSPSGRDGYFSGTIRLSDHLPEGTGITSTLLQLPFSLNTRHTNINATGFVQLISREGLSIVSDIDDTIKISDVRNRDKLLRNTFLADFKPVPGMAELYRVWATNDASAFHYVSASPYQLYLPLSEFLTEHRFPGGTLHLRSINVQNGWAQVTQGPQSYKLGTIEPLLMRFPKREFVLVGDSGEHDPEIYGELARRFPAQVKRIYIRDVTGEAADGQRYAKAFANVPLSTWTVFTEAGKLR